MMELLLIMVIDDLFNFAIEYFILFLLESVLDISFRYGIFFYIILFFILFIEINL